VQPMRDEEMDDSDTTVGSEVMLRVSKRPSLSALASPGMCEMMMMMMMMMMVIVMMMMMLLLIYGLFTPLLF
jgi:hypothetical protein